MHMKAILACTLALVFAGSASAQAPAADAAVAPEIKVNVTSTPAGFSVAADRDKLVFVEFAASPALTAELRQALAAAGYQLADTRAQAGVSYDFDGAFQALRPATNRTAEVRAGEFAEGSGEVATKSARGKSFMVSANPVVTLLGTVFANAGNSTGARDATNIATVGDPDGKCLAKCEGWIYRQRAVINVSRTEGSAKQTTSALASIVAPGLQPGELFARAYADLAAATGLPTTGRFAARVKAE